MKLNAEGNGEKIDGQNYASEQQIFILVIDMRKSWDVVVGLEAYLAF